jgi:glycosyltransferase involved in cell wall biosynthesis
MRNQTGPVAPRVRASSNPLDLAWRDRACDGTYPVDFFSLFRRPGRRGRGGAEWSGRQVAPENTAPHPLAVGQFALGSWNAYSRTGQERHRRAFMSAVRWLVAEERLVGSDSGGGYVPEPAGAALPATTCPSASSQGIGISALTRAYRLTGDPTFLAGATRAATPLGRDVLDGGLNTPLHGDGLFFEDVAQYPADHALHGHLLALLGLIELWWVRPDMALEELIERGIRALRSVLGEFEGSDCTRYSLRHRGPAPEPYPQLQVLLLKAIADCTGLPEPSELGQRWERYQTRWSARTRQAAALWRMRLVDTVVDRMRRVLFPPRLASHRATTPERVLVPVTAFPVTGGIRAVLGGIAEAMRNEWRMEYLARDVRPHGEDVLIHRFGSRLTSPWQFPTVWLYVLAGAATLGRILRREEAYRLVLAQDSVFTGAFAGLVGRLAGARVVAVEHGTITFPYSAVYKAERLSQVSASSSLRRLSARIVLSLYWPSLRALSRTAVRCTDHFLVAGQESADVYIQHLGVPPSRITRWRFMIDAATYAPPDPRGRREQRARLGISSDSVLISIVARFSPAKGLDIALAGLGQALSQFPVDWRQRIQIVIAGDGPLRARLEADITNHGLRDRVALWGEKSSHEVVRLLGVTDIFLYTSTRGTNYSMAVLEAMASGCAVIASTEPRSNAELLAEGRGIAIPPGDPAAVSDALVRALADIPGCHRMGRLARAYISEVHTEEALRRSLLRACGWSPSLRPPPGLEREDQAVSWPMSRLRLGDTDGL